MLVTWQHLGVVRLKTRLRLTVQDEVCAMSSRLASERVLLNKEKRDNKPAWLARNTCGMQDTDNHMKDKKITSHITRTVTVGSLFDPHAPMASCAGVLCSA